MAAIEIPRSWRRGRIGGAANVRYPWKRLRRFPGYDAPLASWPQNSICTSPCGMLQQDRM